MYSPGIALVAKKRLLPRRRHVDSQSAARALHAAPSANLLRRRLRIESLEDRRLLAVVTVNTIADSVDFNDGVTSLREAIFATNLVGGPDTIQFDFGHDGPATIQLTLGELKITDPLTINGPGAELLTIDASGNDPTPDVKNGDGSRVFNIDDTSEGEHAFVSVKGITLTGGDVNGFGGAIRNREDLVAMGVTISNNSALQGGGIDHSSGSLAVTDSTIIGNQSLRIANDGGDGGGVAAIGSAGSMRIALANSTIIGNTAARRGGGIFGRDMLVTDSKISDNSAGSSGGGIFEFGGVSTVTTSTISGNSAVDGGGGLFGVRSVRQSTISDNSAGGNGGGLSGVQAIRQSTVSGNSAGRSGGGIFGYAAVEYSTITDNSAAINGGGILGFATNLRHTIVAGNRGGPTRQPTI